MSLKTKITSLITTFILLCSLLTVGVFAVKNTTFNVGGDIVFNVQGIEATITRGATAGFTSEKTIGNEAGNILSDIELNNEMTAQDVADEFAPWSGLELAFEEGSTTATIKLTIKNTAQAGADNYLDVTALADATTKNNARISVVNDAGGITALLEPQQSASFTITFSVIDNEYSASLEGFSVNFDMQKKVLADFPALSADMTYSTFKFTTINGENGLSVKDIGADNNNCQSTGDITIPAYVQKDNVIYAVTKIGMFGDSMDYSSTITSVSIPYTVTNITGSAFYGCTKLLSVSIPNGVTSIEGETFYNCGSLTSITIPDSVTRIENGAFSGCESLSSLIIPDSVTKIGFEAFCGCSFTSIIIPAGVTYFDMSTFSGCSSLTSITIPDSVTSIDQGVFAGCSSLTTVNYTGTEEEWNALLENIESGNDELINATIHFGA